MGETQNIDGKAVAKALREDLAAEVAGLDVRPGLAVILVGDDPASQVYVRNKIKACAACGIKSFESRLPAQATEAEIMAEIEAFNDNKDVHGILLQLPLPYPLNADTLIQHIKPEKDVDGLTFINQGKLIAGDKSGLVPCTPQGAMMLIKSVEQDLSGKHAVVIGRSLLFGKPMAQLLLAENCTVTSAHSRTRDLPEVCKQADILVAAVGRAEMVQGAWIKPGAIVIDVGINRQEGGTLCGDVDYDQARGVAGAITPVPGGVGPMTIACLLKNTVEAAKKAKN
ncbi:MAG: bifunctional methylenetetrahydrofolate dehydrogenase/methenyltetrahydrofolate cyclohydrolase FolD [Rhodospirillales bacterium]|nr:bifunctional methylenetetrahydrofolate dehydrogenase/methenyltetrahydrofolate cyclohydrolase FolD [Alphaproteobacteria bacterium]MCB9981560.1 bifunctional methylenetetrahydrofolate dehydrogenase/methenyltetrahydrofolate cyclohydrolase FolD [Rhodospirillales bacterium]